MIILTANQLAEKLELKLLTESNDVDNEVNGCYIGDLLSWVMAKAKDGNIWLTVMGNVNAVAVAVLTDVSCIVLCENAELDSEAKIKAEENEIIIFQTEKNSFSLACEISNLI